MPPLAVPPSGRTGCARASVPTTGRANRRRRETTSKLRARMKRAILARHGESEVLLAGLVSGDPAEPSGLTSAGREQARRLGELVAGEPIDLCVTSEFARTRETAD